jgi:peptidyl-prolyl cis-trans isomerase C
MFRLPMRRFAGASVLLALAAALTGCGADRDVLARVDNETITIAEFNDVARNAAAQYPGAADSARMRLLEDLVQRELLVQGARRLQLDAAPEFQAFRASLERQVLREALYRQMLAGPFPVSDAEVRALYDRRGEATHTRIIYAWSPAAAASALADLERGEDFAAVADRYNPAGMLPPGGDVGLVQAGALLPPLDETVRTGPLGRTVGPVEVPGEGWFILRLEERKPVERGPFESERAQLAEMLRQRKQRVVARRTLDNLRTLYQVKVAPGAPQAVIAAFRSDPERALQNPPPPGPGERERVLATFTGGRYTLGEAYDDLAGGAGNRPNLEVTPSVERWIEAQVIDRAALLEARRRHLHEDPAIQQQLRERVNNQLLENYYRIAVIERAQATPDDFARAYERQKSALTTLSSARIQSVVLPDSAAAAALAAVAGQAPSLREAAAAAGAAGRVREESLTFPLSTRDWQGIDGLLMAMAPGQIHGPVATPRGWLILQLVDKQQGTPALEALPPASLAQLQNVATELRREARLAALTDSLRRVIAVQVHAGRLKRVPWPPAPAPPGT